MSNSLRDEHANGECRFGLKLQDEHWVQLTLLDRIGSLWLWVCTGSRTVAGMRSEERLERNPKVGGITGVTDDWMMVGVDWGGSGSKNKSLEFHRFRRPGGRT